MCCYKIFLNMNLSLLSICIVCFLALDELPCLQNNQLLVVDRPVPQVNYFFCTVPVLSWLLFLKLIFKSKWIPEIQPKLFNTTMLHLFCFLSECNVFPQLIKSNNNSCIIIKGTKCPLSFALFRNPMFFLYKGITHWMSIIFCSRLSMLIFKWNVLRALFFVSASLKNEQG